MDKNSIYYVCAHYLMGDGKRLGNFFNKILYFVVIFGKYTLFINIK